MSAQVNTHTTVSINNVLFQRIEQFKSYKNYVDSTQAIEELLQKALDDYIEELEDEWLLELVAERKKNDTGVRISHEAMWKNLGITQEEIDLMEDVELEYELPN